MALNGVVNALFFVLPPLKFPFQTPMYAFMSKYRSVTIKWGACFVLLCLL